MPMKATYLTVNGEIVSETRNGVERDYMPDPLGSTAALLDSSGITDAFSYWPYGEVRSHIGPSTTPFQYVGTLGYCADSPSSYYVRARYLQPNYARWLTVDPLWPDESAYGYVDGNVITAFDTEGLQVAECATAGTLVCPGWGTVVGAGVGILVLGVGGLWYLSHCQPTTDATTATAGPTLRQCEDTHDQYKKDCADGGGCRKIPIGDSSVGSKLASLLRCIQGRSWVQQNCDRNPLLGWVSKPGTHAKEVCKAVAAYCNCAKRAGVPTGNSLCTTMLTACKARGLM